MKFKQKKENEDQIEHFCKQYQLKIDGPGFFKSLPKNGQMDSFFSATLSLKWNLYLISKNQTKHISQNT